MGRFPSWKSPGKQPIKERPIKRFLVIFQARKKHKPKLLSPDIFWWGRGLPHEGVGAKKVRYVPRSQGNQTFWAGYPRILPGYPGGHPKSLRKKNCVQFWSAANGGLRYIWGKGLFPPSSGFLMSSSHPLEKGEKGRKRAKKADFGRFPGRAARHPLSPHLLHPHLRQPNLEDRNLVK